MRGGGLKAAGADCADCAATAAAAGAELTGTVVGLARVCRQAPSQWGSGTMATAASKSAAKGQQGLFAVAAEAERARGGAATSAKRYTRLASMLAAKAEELRTQVQAMTQQVHSGGSSTAR